MVAVLLSFSPRARLSLRLSVSSSSCSLLLLITILGIGQSQNDTTLLSFRRQPSPRARGSTPSTLRRTAAKPFSSSPPARFSAAHPAKSGSAFHSWKKRSRFLMKRQDLEAGSLQLLLLRRPKMEIKRESSEAEEVGGKRGAAPTGRLKPCVRCVYWCERESSCRQRRDQPSLSSEPFRRRCLAARTAGKRSLASRQEAEAAPTACDPTAPR